MKCIHSSQFLHLTENEVAAWFATLTNVPLDAYMGYVQVVCFSSAEYEQTEKKRVENQLKDYERQLEHDTESEKTKHDRNVQLLNQRKEELIKKQREQIKSEIERASQDGAGKQEQDRLLDEHNKNLEKLVNKMDADKLRMESHLQVR